MIECVIRAFSPSVLINSAAIEQCRKRFSRLRLILPLFMLIFSIVWEVTEHTSIRGYFELDAYIAIEIFIFGVIGPLLVYLFLTYLISLFKKLASTTRALEELTNNLEAKIEERTHELEQRNRELANANQQLKTLDQLKSDFVSMVSHELKGPLTTLNGGLELALQESDEMPSEAQHLIQVLAKESNRLTIFVQTILDLSRIEAGYLVVNPGPVAIAPMIKHVIDVVFSSNSRQVTVDMLPDVPPVWADEIFLERILVNLLTNAEKYSPANLPVEIKVTQQNEIVGITVTDYGPGIPAEMQDIVFDRFQRLENGKLVNANGLGLGLYLAKMLTTAQNGLLTIESPVHSNPDTPGTSFNLILPVTEEVPEYA